MSAVVENLGRLMVVGAVAVAVVRNVGCVTGTTRSSPLDAVTPFRIGKNHTELHFLFHEDCRYPHPRVSMMQLVLVLDARHN